MVGESNGKSAPELLPILQTLAGTRVERLSPWGMGDIFSPLVGCVCHVVKVKSYHFILIE